MGQAEVMTDKPQLFHCMRYTDAGRGIAFLESLGFTAALIVPDPDDDTIVVHAEMRWRDNGGVMLGSVRGRGDDHYRLSTCNLVVDDDAEVDRLVAVAVAAGAQVITEPNDAPHGGRNACVVDFDGNYWNLDSYQGA